MVKPKNAKEAIKIKPPFFVKDSEPMMSKLYYSEEEFGYNKEGQVFVKAKLVWSAYLRTGIERPTLTGTPFAYRHVGIVRKDDWLFVARPRDMEAGDLVIYTEQEVFQQAIKSIFTGAVIKSTK